MTRFEQFDRALMARGWAYDVSQEVFRGKSGRMLQSAQLMRLLPDMTLDELARYVDDRHDKSSGAAGVRTVYVLLPGASVAFSEDGNYFKPHVLLEQLQFSDPTSTTDTTMTFEDGEWQVRVDRAKVVVSRYDE